MRGKEIWLRQCSCLENPRNGGTWWAAVSGVAQCRTRLKRLNTSTSSRSGMLGASALEFGPGALPIAPRWSKNSLTWPTRKPSKEGFVFSCF